MDEDYIFILIDIEVDNLQSCWRNQPTEWNEIRTSWQSVIICFLMKCKLYIQIDDYIIIHLAQLSNLIGPFVPRDRPEKNGIGRLAFTLTQK